MPRATSPRTGTDSITLIGTNDLGGTDTVADIEGLMSPIYEALAPPFSFVWAATLLPKDPNVPNLATLQAQLTAINEWLRTGSPPIGALLDFQSVLWVSPQDPVDYAPGMTVDGIHPSVEGQLLLGQYAAAQIQAAGEP